MSDFRPGDGRVDIAGVPTRLRFTVSALAEIAGGLEAASPKDLAACLRKASPQDWNIIFQAMATPRPAHNLSNQQLLDVVPVLSRIMTEGLSP